MEFTSFIELTTENGFLLLIVGFVGGLVSGFIGSGGAFVLTPAMMSLGVPGIVAVASNMAHKFPKALVAAIKRHKLGQVDIKLGLIMGLFAEIGVYFGKGVMIDIRDQFGDLGTDFYVSIVFVITLAIVGGLIVRDAMKKEVKQEHNDKPNLAKRVQSIVIPGTMVYLPSINAKVSFLIIAPLGFATGLLASFIAVGGFIGVPAMMYILGVPAIMATATELVVAFVMGLGGSMLYAWDGLVDIRLSMMILAGSLFGVQIGVIATTYIKEATVKIVMATIMIIVLISRLFMLPIYLSQLNFISALDEQWMVWLEHISSALLVIALGVGALSIIGALIHGATTGIKKPEMKVS